MLSCLITILNSVCAQDLIITHENDSINCKITKMKDDYLYFTFIYNGKNISTLLPTSNIKDFQFDFYKTNNLPQKRVNISKDYPRFRLTAQGGYSYMFQRVDGSLPSYLVDLTKKLKSGYNLGINTIYYATELVGVGIKGSLFKSSSSVDNIPMELPDSTVKLGKMSDKLTTLFIAPQLSLRFQNGKKKNTATFINFAIGYIRHIDNIFMIYSSAKATGNAMGLACDIGHEIGLTDKIALGIQVSGLYARLKSLKIDSGGEIKVNENISRVDASIVLTFTR